MSSTPSDTARVPLLRDGSASLGRVINYRVVWAALALIVGIDSVSLVVNKGADLGIGRIVIPGVLCAVGSAFALWQAWLVVIAARRFARSGGGNLFASLAIVGALAAAGGIAGLLNYKALPQLEELWDIHHGDEAKGELDVFVPFEGGRVLIIDGRLGMGSARQVKDVLDANPNVRTVVTTGPGGRASAAYQIYLLIRARQLDTRAIRPCYSACTIMFLGGVRRSLGSMGQLGFHRTSFPGMDEAELTESNRHLRDFLIFRAGIEASFVRKVMDTPPESIWVPTPEELLAAGVIHHADERRK